MRLSPYALPLLARLRRSTRLAMFLALVMVTKLVGSYACLSEDVPGAASGHPASQVASVGDDTPTPDAKAPGDAGDPSATHAAASCCHCTCHQATALLDGSLVIESRAHRLLQPGPAPISLPSNVERELRPPIA